MVILKKKVKVVQSANTPIVLIVSNNGDVAEECFLFSSQGITKNKKSKVKAEFDSFGINYEELIWSLRTDPLEVTQTYIESRNIDQIVSKIQVANSFISGLVESRTYHPRRDPNQFQSGVIVLKEKIVLDYYSHFRFVIQPKTTVTYSFYLKQEDKYIMVSRLKPIKEWFQDKFKAIKSKLSKNK